MTLRAMLVTLDINVEKARFASFFHLFFLFICVCRSWVWLVWGCFDVLFFITEFHFLLLLIFILFSLAYLFKKYLRNNSWGLEYILTLPRVDPLCQIFYHERFYHGFGPKSF